MLKVYNTLTRKKEEFIPVESGKVKMYVCGMTVYSDAHIGHARTYVAFDIIRRYFEYKGYEVTYVQNITDVDDKIINAANKEGIDALEYSKRYAERCFRDLELLGIKPADIYPKASETIDDMIEMIKKIIKNGYGYEADGDVYFSVEKFKDYGKLSKQKIEEMKVGARIEPGEKKRNPLDFALWKKAKPGEPSWDSPWGKGRPGWHIECSTMSSKYLGLPFDIHGGGMDLIFPHHENEIAQAEAAYGKGFAKYWLHSGMLKVRGEKMSKSLGNIINVRDALKQWDAEVLRFFFASYHYRSPADFSEKAIEMAERGVERINRVMERLKEAAGNASREVSKLNEKEKEYYNAILDFRKKFEEAMDDDFNTPRAIASIFDFVEDTNKYFMKSQKPSKELCKYAWNTLFDLGKILTLFQEKKYEKIPITRAKSIKFSIVIIPAIEGEILKTYKLLKILEKYNKNIYFKLVQKHIEVMGIIEKYGMESGVDNFLSDFPGDDEKALKEFTIKYGDEINIFLEEIMKEILEIRENARKDKNWKLADAIRDELSNLGFEIQDTADGPKWRKK